MNNSLVNRVLAISGRLMPMSWITRISGMLLGPKRAPIDVRNERIVHASPEQVWDLLADVGSWPSWYRACRWLRRDGAAGFLWKAHPIELESTVTEATRGRSFAFTAIGVGLRGQRTFTLRLAPDGRSTVVSTRETQEGPLPWIGRAMLARRLHAVTEEWLRDIEAAVGASGGSAQLAVPTALRYG